MQARQPVQHELPAAHGRRARAERCIVLERQGTRVEGDAAADAVHPRQNKHAVAGLGDGPLADGASEVQCRPSVHLHGGGSIHAEALGADGRGGRTGGQEEPVNAPAAPLSIDGTRPEFATGEGEAIDVRMTVDRQQAALVDAGGIHRPIGVVEAAWLVHEDLPAIDDDVAGRTAREAAGDRQRRAVRHGVAGAEAVVGGIPRFAAGDRDDARYVGSAQRASPHREVGVHAAIEVHRRTGATDHRKPEVGARIVDQALQHRASEPPAHR